MYLPDRFTFHCPLKICCGSRALAHLPWELAALNAHTPLVLASRTQLGARGLKTALKAFKASDLTAGLYDRMADTPEPDLLPVLAALYRKAGCDSIVAIGYGAVPDMAKNLKWMLIQNDGMDRSEGVTRPTLFSKPVPLVLITTPGTSGDEVSGHIHMHGGTGLISSPELVPNLACIDPAMMQSDNPVELVNGALIALTAAIEVYLDDRAGPLGRAWAHTAIGLIMPNLPVATKAKNKRAHLCAVVNGAVVAGGAFFACKAEGCRALARQLQEQSSLPAGFVTALLTPHLLEEISAIQPERVGRLLYPMEGAHSVAMTAAALKAARSVAIFREFIESVNAAFDLKIPATPAEAGLTEAQLTDLPFLDYLQRS